MCPLPLIPCICDSRAGVYICDSRAGVYICDSRAGKLMILHSHRSATGRPKLSAHELVANSVELIVVYANPATAK